MKVDDGQNVVAVIFSKHFMTGTALHANEILHDFVLYRIVIALSAKISYNFCVKFNVDFCYKYAYLWCDAKLFLFQ